MSNKKTTVMSYLKDLEYFQTLLKQTTNHQIQESIMQVIYYY